MIQFYAPQIADMASLPPEESAHCARVLRKQPGDTVVAVDGKGNRYHCRITAASAKRVDVEVESVEKLNKSWRGVLAVAVAPTKNLDRMEWLVEKVTELGVDIIVPLLCDRSERRVLKEERLERIAVSAMKQSLKATLPVVAPLTPFAEIVSGFEGFNRYIAYCDRTIERKLFTREYIPGGDTLLVIGPEGDFSPEEIRSALEAGFVPVSLGDERLRTETAAMYGIAAMHALGGI